MIYILPPKGWSLEERIQHYLLWLLKISVVVAAVIALALGLWETFFLSLLALVLMFLPEFIESRVKISLPVEFDLGLALFIYAAIFLGGVLGAYQRFWWWDAVLHTSSGFILGFAGFLLLYVKVLQKKLQASKLVIGLLIFSVGLAFGAVWEVFEFVVDGLFGTGLQRFGLHDTMWDLIVDGLGALVIALIGTRFIERGGKGFIARWIKRFIRANPGLGGN